MGAAAWLAGTAAWVGVADRVLAAGPRREESVRALAEARLAPWEGGPTDAIERLRAANPEYDLMARTFLALALGDLAVADPDRWRRRALAALDAMIADTTRQVDEGGPEAFLLPYWHRGRTHDGRSLFVDGERLLVLGIRRFLEEHRGHADASARLAEPIVAAMAAGPVASAESYPDECWTFCNTVALGALRVAGVAHEALAARWCAGARERLDASGMLVSSYRRDGAPLDGPEGSSLWMSAHMLRLVDPTLAREQYALARAALGRDLLGFSWATEWPTGAEGHVDIDSGPIVPLMQASPSSSGLAVLAARSFGDEAFFDGLTASLGLAAIPQDAPDGRRYLASNALGDAVVLAGLTTGPLWDGLGAGV